MQIPGFLLLAMPAVITLIIGLTVISLAGFLHGKISSEIPVEPPGLAELLLRKEIETQELIFQHISLELHDRVGHLLSMARMQLEVVKPGSFLLTETASLVDISLEELRGLSRSLNGDVLKSQGLYKCLEWELRQMSNSGRFVTELKQTGEPLFLDDQQELAVLRIAQECFSNIIKHSGSFSVNVFVVFEPRQLNLTIIDRGKGFHVEEAYGVRGCGITNMHKRCRLINAVLSINSKPGEGTTIIIKIPIHDRRGRETETGIDR